MAAAYVAFAVVVALAIRRGVPSCGCFGRRAAPPARVHVVTNLASALVAMIVGGTALRAGDDVAAVWAPLRGVGWTGVTEVVLVAMCAGLVIALDTDGAALAHEVRIARAAR